MITSRELNDGGALLFPFLRTLAHEMSAPLTSVLGYAQLNLQMTPEPDEIQDDMTEIEQAAQKMRKQLGALGRFSRYNPLELTCSSAELEYDLQLVAEATARREECDLIWTCKSAPGTDPCKLKANPWILRVVCLGLIGSVLEEKSSEIQYTVSHNGFSITVPATNNPTSSEESPTPDTLGHQKLAEAIASKAKLDLSKDEDGYTLKIARFVED